MKYQLFNTPVQFDYNEMFYIQGQDFTIYLTLFYLALYYSVKYSIPEFREDLKQKLIPIKYLFLCLTLLGK